MITKNSSIGKSCTSLGAMAVLAVSAIGAVFFFWPEIQSFVYALVMTAKGEEPTLLCEYE